MYAQYKANIDLAGKNNGMASGSACSQTQAGQPAQGHKAVAEDTVTVTKNDQPEVSATVATVNNNSAELGETSGKDTGAFASVRPTDNTDELQVEEEVRQKWERDQVQYLKHLRLTDEDEWARLHVTASDNHQVSCSHPLEFIGGVDISFVKGDHVNACAALVVVQLPSLEVVYSDCTMVKLTAPYIPGFLAFREAEFLIEKVHHLQEIKPEYMPQVILSDGNGILHPRGYGIACHLGVALDLPTIGAAKKLFQVDGLENDNLHKEKIEKLSTENDTFPLVGSSGRTLGMTLKSTPRTTNPIYVSPGHKISMETAVWVVKQCCLHRVPEPVRQADIQSREYLRQNFKQEIP